MRTIKEIDYLEELKEYEIEITLRYPMINDEFEWKDKSKKSLGYSIKKGVDKVKDLVDKTSYQLAIHRCSLGRWRRQSPTWRNFLGTSWGLVFG